MIAHARDRFTDSWLYLCSSHFITFVVLNWGILLQVISSLVVGVLGQSVSQPASHREGNRNRIHVTSYQLKFLFII